MERVERTFVELQGLNTLVCKRLQLLSKLASNIAGRTNVVGPLSKEEIEERLQRGGDDHADRCEQDVTTAQAPARIDSLSNERPSITAAAPEDQQGAAVRHKGDDVNNNNLSRRRTFRSEQYILDSQSAITTIEECGTFVIYQLDTMRASREHIITFDMIVRIIAHFSLDLIEGISTIVAEESPPVLPIELCALSHRDFGMLLEKQSTRLRHTMTSQEIEMLDEQLCNLKLAYCEEAGIKNSLDVLWGVQSMKECWSPLDKSYDLLCTFCGGIATVMPGTSSVEADFSSINWIRDPNLSRMTDFSLESILHCKQRDRLAEVWNKQLNT